MNVFRKTIALALISLAVFSFKPVSVSAQDDQSNDIPSATEEANLATFNDAYKTYLESINSYNASHGQYVLKRAQYLRFQTLKSQSEAKDATEEMLIKRDQVVIDYLRMIWSKLKETEGVEQSVRESLGSRISLEIGWFLEHQERIPSSGTLKDLVNDSNEAVDLYDKSTQIVIYETLSRVAEGKVANFESRLNDVFLELKAKVEEIRNEEREEFKFSTRKNEIIGRWMFESENRIGRAQEKMREAEGEIAAISVKRGKGNYRNVYTGAVDTLKEAQILLKESSSYLKEVIEEIKIEEV